MRIFMTSLKQWVSWDSDNDQSVEGWVYDRYLIESNKIDMEV